MGVDLHVVHADEECYDFYTLLFCWSIHVFIGSCIALRFWDIKDTNDYEE